MAIRLPLRALVSAAALVLGAAARPQAVPLYYAFAGQVIYTTLPGYPLGMDVTYVFRVDRDAPGYIVDGNGNVLVQGDDVESPDYFRKYFLADFVGGNIIPTDNPASPIKESDHFGMDIMRYESELYSALNGSNSDPSGADWLSVWSGSSLFSDWQVGQSFLGEDVVLNGPGESNSSYSSSLVLASIGESNPLEVQAVPEPRSYALFALGLLGLCLSLRGPRPKRP